MHFLKHWRKASAIVLSLGLLVYIGCESGGDVTGDQDPFDGMAAGTPIDGQYIVVMNSLAKSSAELASEMAVKYNAKIGFTYETFKGFSAEVPADKIDALRADARVKYVELDQVVRLIPYIEEKTSLMKSDAQTTPWGITRVGGAGDGIGKVMWSIDTGVDLTHPDLNVDVARSRTFITNGPDSKSANDLNGHGTHTSGTVAAKNDANYVVGVAAGATVVAVKVLNRQGSGTNSGVIAGVDYVGATGKFGDAANMSLGGGVSQALDDAVISASNKGIKFAIAAGNSSADANNSSPARANGANIYTVSAINSSDVFASFSNWGNPPIDYAAPGVSVLSLWKNGGTNTISGTSMATPHVCGILLLGNITTSGFAIGDPDGNPDPIAHR